MGKEEIKTIAANTNLTVKERIDELLMRDADMYTNLGSDSSKAEIEEVKKNSRVIYRAIKDLDAFSGSQLLYYQDKEYKNKEQ
tara:strand:- start:1446 stop:1694 length:249 start_codon:yes stop_codon:yes gene_type:complete